MVHALHALARSAPAALPNAHVMARTPHSARNLASGLGPGPFAAVVVYISPDADLPALAAGLAAQFGPCPVIGCTSAGEISADGYTEGEIVAVGFPAHLFAASTLRVDHLDRLQP